MKWPWWCLFCLPFTLHAGSEAPFLPPEDVVRQALAEAPESRFGTARQAVAQARARLTRMGPHTAELSLVPQERRIDGEGRYREWEASLSHGVRWPGKAKLDRALAADEIAQADAELADQRHRLAQELLADWSAWRRAQVAAQLLTAQRSDWERERAALARRVALGDAAERELLQVDAGLAEARAAEAEAVAAENLSREALQRAFPTLPLPSGAPPPPAAPAWQGDDADWLAALRRHDHAREATLIASRAATLAARRVRADRLPDPTIGLGTLSERGGRERAVALTVSLSLGWRQQSARRAEAEAHALQGEAEAALAEREGERRIRQMLERARSLGTISQARDAAAEASARHLDKVLRSRSLGEADLTEELLARRDAQDTELAAARARIDANAALAALRIDARGLWLDEADRERGQ